MGYHFLMTKYRKSGKTGKALLNSGFSLFEIIIAFLVLSILVFTSFLYFPPQLAKARDSKRKADLNRLRTALMDYHDSSSSFPSSLESCRQPLSLNQSVLLNSIPCDPKLTTPYYYESNQEGSWFKLYTNLENLDDPDIHLKKCDQGCGPDCAYNFGVSSPNTDIDNCLPPPLLYACSPGGGQEGACEIYDDPGASECPMVFEDDPTCRGLCVDSHYRCRDSSGKHVPEQ